jgi:hypothetical protein
MFPKRDGLSRKRPEGGSSRCSTHLEWWRLRRLCSRTRVICTGSAKRPRFLTNWWCNGLQQIRPHSKSEQQIQSNSGLPLLEKFHASPSSMHSRKDTKRSPLWQLVGYIANSHRSWIPGITYSAYNPFHRHVLLALGPKRSLFS